MAEQAFPSSLKDTRKVLGGSLIDTSEIRRKDKLEHIRQPNK